MIPNNNDIPPLPSYPTAALPGSEIKAKVMQHRVERGVHPHHPDDALDDDEGRGYLAATSAKAVRDRERIEKRNKEGHHAKDCR